MKFICPEISESEISQKLENYLSHQSPFSSRQETSKFILNCIDHTSLEGTDNDSRIHKLCEQALDIRQKTDDHSTVASVCVYPVFAETANRCLRNTGIGVACVAGAFPSGQSPLHLRVAEAVHAVEAGATEIDMVISRGRMLEGDYSYVFHEIRETKKGIGKTHLKVILETGELTDLNIIRKATEIAIQAGADFVKTSTGKIKPAATPEAFLAMCDVIKTYYQEKNIKTGIKAAGGISDMETAEKYLKILKGHLGEEWLNKGLFRIGASRLTMNIL